MRLKTPSIKYNDFLLPVDATVGLAASLDEMTNGVCSVGGNVAGVTISPPFWLLDMDDVFE